MRRSRGSFLVLGTVALILSAGCRAKTPTDASTPAEAFVAREGGSALRSTAGGIQVFYQASDFERALRASTVRTVSQDLSSTGRDVGGGLYELQLEAVRIQMRGPAFYGNVLGVDVLSKGVPVTVLFPSTAQGAGLEIAQLSTVKVTALARDGETFVLDAFENDTVGFLGFTSPAGIASIEISDPDPSDTSTPITNLGDVTFGEMGPESLPLDCAVLRERRPSARVSVEGKTVTVEAVAHGVGVPGEVDVGPAIVGSVGRFRLWPNGRHRPPSVTSEVFPSLSASDFPRGVELRYRYPDGTPSGEAQAGFDYELLSACFDDVTGALEVGAIDEFGTCRPGEYVILQCDRGLSYVLE